MKSETDITIILDRSGSMHTIKEAIIRGYNSFLKEHKSSGVKTKISLIQFDHEYDLIYQAKNIKKVNFIDDYTYNPRGTTALLDAIGLTIIRLSDRMAINTKKTTKKVIIAIITDGEENSSSEFTRNQIFKMISENAQENHWTFLFLAANQDAILEGSNFGISKHHCLTIKHSLSGFELGFNSLIKQSMNLSTQRTKRIKFSEEDRLNQLN